MSLPEWLDSLYEDEEPPVAPYQDDDLAWTVWLGQRAEVAE